MEHGRSVQTRLVLGILALTVAVVTLLGSWQVIEARDSQRADIENGEVTAARLAGRALGNAVEVRLAQLSGAAAEPVVTRLASAQQWKQLSEKAPLLHLLYPGFASFDIISSTGRIEGNWASTPTVATDERTLERSFRAVVLAGGPVISAGLELASPRALVVALSVPIEGTHGQIVGVLQATVNAATLSSLVGGSGLLGDAKLVIIDQQGHPLSGPAAGTAHTFRSVAMVERALNGRTGSGNGVVPGFVGSRLVGYAPVAPIGWAVIVEAPSSTLNGPVAALTERLAAISLILFALVLGAAIIIGILLRRLSREQEKATAVLTSVGEGVVTLDETGQLIGANPALARLVGLSTAQLEGRAWSETPRALYDDEGAPVEWKDSLIATAILEHRVVASTGYSLHLAGAGGRRIPVALTAAPLATDDGRDGAVVIIRDVSHQREVDELKSSLISRVSHELRTPLTMIQGFSEILLTRPDLGAERSRESLQQIQTSSRRLGRLIDDLLCVSRIEAGRISVDLASVEVENLLSEVLSPFEAQNGRAFVTELDPALGPVLADRDKTVQILTNLVSNAVKYSPAGAPVRIVAKSAGDHAEFSVADDGIGMSAEDSTCIFDKFTRLDHPLVRKVAGTGLGLYITKNLVEIQQGHIWVQSEPGHGSTFTFSLPMAPQSLTTANRTEEPA